MEADLLYVLLQQLFYMPFQFNVIYILNGKNKKMD